MRRRLVVAGLLSSVLAASAADAASISFSSRSVNLSDGPFQVDIFADGVTELVFGYQFSFVFDPAILALDPVDGIVDGDFLSRTGETFFDASPVDGIPTITEFYIGDSKGDMGGGLLASLKFIPLSVGKVGLVLFSSEDLPAGFQAEIDFIPAELSGTIGVVGEPPTPVPEPSTLALLGIGLAAMARKRLRRKSERSV